MEPLILVLFVAMWVTTAVGVLYATRMPKRRHMSPRRKYTLDEIVISVSDLAEETRTIFGQNATYPDGGTIPEHDYRFLIEAGNARTGITRITLERRASITAEEILRTVNSE